MNTIIHYLIFQNQHLQQTISFLLKFICKHIPLRQWVFDDSNSPKYRKFKVDEPPLVKKKESEMCWYYKDFIAYIKRKYGKDIKPVKRQGVCDIPDDYICPHCNAPKEYLYRNNGSHSQVICKVCGRSSSTFVPNNNISLSCGINPNIVAGVIFKEQYSNYNWVDICTDWVAFYGVIDMSVGLGQVRVSTAKFLEEQGYVPETSAEEGGWNIPFIGFVHGTETMAREKRLEDNSWNIMYVAAYIKYFEDAWIDVFPKISSRPDILGTLYNIGHEKTSPNSNPSLNDFGDDVAYFMI